MGRHGTDVGAHRQDKGGKNATPLLVAVTLAALIVASLFALAAFGFSLPATAQEARPAGEQQLLGQERNGTDRFGEDVALEGDVAVVGAREDPNYTGPDDGEAYVFERGESGGWEQRQKLLASDAQDSDHFGEDVELSGRILAISSAPADGRGTVYVFERGQDGRFVEEQQIRTADLGTGTVIIAGVVLRGPTMVIGALRRPAQGGTEEEFLKVMRREASGRWVAAQTLNSPSSDWYANFGSATGRGGVDIRGRTMIVGAFTEQNAAGQSAGAAYVYEQDAGGKWGLSQKIVASDASAYDYFGSEVALGPGTALVGAGGGGAGGGAYAYVRAGDGRFRQTQKLSPSDPGGAKPFVSDLAIEGDTALWGDFYGFDRTGSRRTGWALLFKRGSDGRWSPYRRLYASDGKAGDYFGEAVDLGGATVQGGSLTALVGAPRDRTSDPDANDEDETGSAYAFEVDATP